MQQREGQVISNLKLTGEQIKTVISITSCNLVEISHQVHKGASWRSQILEGSGREKKKCFIFVYKGILNQPVGKCKRKGFPAQWYDLKVVRNLYLSNSPFLEDLHYIKASE